MSTRVFPPRVYTTALIAAFGALGSMIFPLFVAWPFAFLFGMAAAKALKNEPRPANVLHLLWAGLWIGVGSILGWFWYHHATPPLFGIRPALWILFGPSFTALFFPLGGLTYLMRAATRRSRTGGTNSTPPSGDHGSSCACPKKNSARSERNGGMRQIALASLSLMSLVIMTGCPAANGTGEQAPSLSPVEDRAFVALDSLTYIKDPRTGLCFAYVWQGYHNGGPALAHVPCDAVKDYLVLPSISSQLR